MIPMILCANLDQFVHLCMNTKGATKGIVKRVYYATNIEVLGADTFATLSVGAFIRDPGGSQSVIARLWRVIRVGEPSGEDFDTRRIQALNHFMIVIRTLRNMLPDSVEFHAGLLTCVGDTTILPVDDSAVRDELQKAGQQLAQAGVLNGAPEAQEVAQEAVPPSNPSWFSRLFSSDVKG